MGGFREYLLPVLQGQRKTYCPHPPPLTLTTAFLGLISFEPQPPCKAECYLHFTEEASEVQNGEMTLQINDKEIKQLLQVPGQDYL